MEVPEKLSSEANVISRLQNVISGVVANGPHVEAVPDENQYEENVDKWFEEPGNHLKVFDVEF
jgi:hypothetical protein